MHPLRMLAHPRHWQWTHAEFTDRLDGIPHVVAELDPLQLLLMLKVVIFNTLLILKLKLGVTQETMFQSPVTHRGNVRCLKSEKKIREDKHVNILHWSGVYLRLRA